MILRLRKLLAGLVASLCLAMGMAAHAADQPLKIAVLENSPPMSFRDANGRLTGFSIEIARALCEEMQARCEFQTIVLERLLDALAGGEFDIAAASLLDTPERRQRILLARPYFRSVTLWYAKPGIEPGAHGLRVAVVKGSAQESYARKQGWNTVAVQTNGELGAPLIAGVAQAAIVPMNSSFNLQKDASFLRLGLGSTVMKAPELVGNASFGINPQRPELKIAVDEALDRIKRNGVYERINTQFLPFRVQ
ncbi:MAG: transporter substrate-binding domain-containing protein [Azonexus sp.]